MICIKNWSTIKIIIKLIMQLNPPPQLDSLVSQLQLLQLLLLLLKQAIGNPPF